MADETIVNNDEEVLDADVEEEETESEGDKDEKTPVRNSAAYFVGKRQGKREAKQELEKEGADEELTPKAQSAIRKEIAPVMDVLKRQADDLDVREHLAKFPDDAKLEKAIRRRMQDWPNVPVAEIAKTLKFGTEQKERTEKKKEVIERTRGSKLSGTSAHEEEVTLPTAEQYKEIYGRMKKGEQLNMETGKWERANR